MEVFVEVKLDGVDKEQDQLRLGYQLGFRIKVEMSIQVSAWSLVAPV